MRPLRTISRAATHLLSPFCTSLGEPAATGDTPRRISWVTVPALGDVRELTRCLRSCLANMAAFGHRTPVLISDDSRDPTDRARRRELIRTEFVGSLSPIHYVDRDARQHLLTRLARDIAIPTSLLQFGPLGGADGTSYGANRNAILLHTQGTLALSLDQDMTCRPGRVGPSRVLLKGVGHGLAEETWFCQSHDDAVSLTPTCTVDILAEHERYLGASVSSLITSALANGGVDLREGCPHLAAAAATGKGVVRITVNGIAGDSGSQDSLWVRLCASESSRGRLRSDERYRTAVTSTQIVRQAETPTISHGAPWGAMVYGFDNRTLLPPFFPTHRSEDRICGLILTRYVGPSCFAHLPWTLTHAPAQRREYSATEPIWRPRMSDVVTMCLSAKPDSPDTAPAADTLRSLGSLLLQYGSLRQSDFNELIRILARRRASRLVAKLEEQRRRVRGEGLRAWADDLRKEIDLLTKAVDLADSWLPTDMGAGTEPGDVARATRAEIRQYGELLCWWPAVVERTTELLDSAELQPERLL
jgi:hypothetical protein